MNILTGEASDDFFGGDVPAAARELLHQAARAQAEQRATLLWTAQAIAPRSLAILYALCKHHAGRREFEHAERAALRGLQEAARQVGLPEDWRALERSAPPPGIDFHSDGPARFWLFMLKALAFIGLRSGRPDEARELLDLLAGVGAAARVGDEVTAALLAGAAGPTGPIGPLSPG